MKYKGLGCFIPIIIFIIGIFTKGDNVMMFAIKLSYPISILVITLYWLEDRKEKKEKKLKSQEKLQHETKMRRERQLKSEIEVDNIKQTEQDKTITTPSWVTEWMGTTESQKDINKTLNQAEKSKSIKEEKNIQSIKKEKVSNSMLTRKEIPINVESIIDLTARPKKKASYYHNIDQKNKTEVELHNYIASFINEIEFELNAKSMKEIIRKGRFDLIQNMDDLATYSAMLHDTITDYIITIKNGIKNNSGNEYLSRSYLDSLFPSFEHVLHRYELQTNNPLLVEFHKFHLLKNHRQSISLFKNNYFENLLILFMKIDSVARIMGENFEKIKGSEFSNLAQTSFNNLYHESFINVTSELLMVEVINKSNNLDIKKELLEKINLEIGVNEGSKTSTSVINKETDKESAKKHYNSYNDDYETIYRDALDNDVALEYFDSDGESGEWFDSNR